MKLENEKKRREIEVIQNKKTSTKETSQLDHNQNYSNFFFVNSLCFKFIVFVLFCIGICAIGGGGHILEANFRILFLSITITRA
jgi:hypothetical protein